MSKYCMECGNEFPDGAKFCISCGKQQNIIEENVEIEPIEASQESTGPAAPDLKATYSKIEDIQYPWLFKGAYAIYCGTSKVGNLPGEFEVTSKLQVEDIDIANKRVKLRSIETINRRIWRKTKKVFEQDLTDWKGIRERLLISNTPVTLEGECEGQTRVEGLGIRRCIIQQYAIRSNRAIVFWDKEYNWPLQYIAIFRYKSKRPSGVLEIMVDAVKESAEMMINLSNGNLQTALKESRSEVLRESSLVISLKETNIPFVQEHTYM